MNAERKLDVIDITSYECGYAGGYSEGTADGFEMGYIEACLDQRKAVKMLREQMYYIRKQRVYGVIMLVLTAIVTILLKDATCAFIMLPLSLALIFSKERWMK